MLSPWKSGALGLCPRCGKGSQFSGILSIRSACAHCNLPLATEDSGDGPVFFALVIVGFLSVGVGSYVELRWQPEWWVHIAIQIPLVFAACIYALRVSKSLLISYQYKHRIRGFENE